VRANTDAIYNSLVSFLETHTQKQIGLVNPPSPTPDMPYAIIYPEDKRRPEDMGFEYDTVDLYFSVKVVGRLPEQALWMSDTIEAIMYDNSLTFQVEDVQICWRYCERGGAIMPSGDDLFEASDDYTLRFEHG
jgi:hypothetical protein